MGLRLTAGRAASITLVLTVGLTSSNVLPVMVSGYLGTRGITETVAGLIATVTLLAAAATSLFAAPRMGAPGRARIARGGLILAVAGFAGSALAGSAATLGLAQAVAGAGCGLAIAGATATYSSMADPDRASAVATIGSTVIIALLLGALPGATTGNENLAFIVLAAVALVAIPFAGGLPDARVTTAPVPLREAPNLRWGLLLALAAALWSAGEAGIFAFSLEVAEVQAGFSTSGAGIVIGVGILFGLPTALLAAIVGNRIGRAIPLAGALSVGVVAKVLIMTTGSETVFAVTQFAWNAAFTLAFIYLLSAGAVLDDRGRWAATVAAALALGGALGPLPVGVLIDGPGYATAGYLMAALSLAALVAGTIAARQTDRIRASAGAPGPEREAA